MLRHVDVEHGCPVGTVHGLHGELAEHVTATGAADVDGALFFGVQVEHATARDQRGIELTGAGHAGFLVHREQHLEGAMDRVRVVRKGQGRGGADAVVGAQRGAHGVQPVAVEADLDALGVEVEFDVRVLFADHVQVALQHRGGHVLLAGRGGDVDHHVARVVPSDLEAAAGGPIHDMGS